MHLFLYRLSADFVGDTVYQPDSQDVREDAVDLRGRGQSAAFLQLAADVAQSRDFDSRIREATFAGEHHLPPPRRVCLQGRERHRRRNTDRTVKAYSSRRHWAPSGKNTSSFAL